MARGRAVDPVTGLSGPEEQFCLALIKTGNGSEAYREAFPNSRKWTTETIAEKGSRLKATDRIQARLNTLRSQLRETTGITLEEHLRELRELREMAKDAGQLSAAISAETNRGKVSGLYVEKVESTLQNPDGSPLFGRIERVVIRGDKK